MSWIGVDLDGTLAEYHGPSGYSIGNPVPAMVERVKVWLAEGKEVRIFTARVCSKYSAQSRYMHEVFVRRWCQRCLGVELPVTAEKDYDMLELWDDRAIRVEPNTGRVL